MIRRILSHTHFPSLQRCVLRRCTAVRETWPFRDGRLKAVLTLLEVQSGLRDRRPATCEPAQAGAWFKVSVFSGQTSVIHLCEQAVTIRRAPTDFGSVIRDCPVLR